MQAASNKISSLLLFCAVALAPLPFGSTAPAAIAFWCVVLGAGLVAADVSPLCRSQLACLGLVALVVAAFGVVLHEQIASRPWSGIGPNPIWEEASRLLDVPLEPSLSIVRNQPVFALGAPLAAMLALTVGFIVAADRDRANRLLHVIVWSGTAFAVFAIVSHFTNPGKLFWRDKVAYTTVLTTPFVNRNAAAMYYGTCSIVGSLLFWRFFRARLPPGPMSFAGLWLALTTMSPFEAIKRGAGTVVCLAAVLLTASRAGTVLTMIGLVLAFTLYFWRDLPRRIGPLVALAIGGLAALTVLQTLGGSTGGRFNEHGLTDPERMETYRATLRMIADHPWLGSGLGTFAAAFPPYRTGSFWGVWDRAHNTLLELAAEGGIPLALVIAAAWIIALVLLINGIKIRRRDTIFPVAALTVAAICLLHAMIDFSLQIPGFSILVFALTGAGVAQSFATRRRRAG